MNKKTICIAVVLIFAIFCSFAQDLLLERYLTSANDKLASHDYEKAFSYVNYVLNASADSEIPINVLILAEEVYYSYLNAITEKNDQAAFILLKGKLEQYPKLASQRIKQRISEIEAVAAVAEKSKKTAITGIPQIVQQGMTEKQLAMILKAEREQQESFMTTFSEQQKQSSESQQSVFETILGQNQQQNKENTKAILSTVILVLGICVVVFIILMIFIMINQRNAKQQQEQFTETLKVVAQLARLPQERNAFDALPSAMMGEPLVIGATVESASLPPPVSTEAEMADLRRLAATCENIGAQIDTVTGRKNNSKNVAELVYKLCMEMGLPTTDSMLYFAAAMIYDIGFLSVDQSVLKSDQLNEDQKYQIRNHVKMGVARLEFVPTQFKSVFVDAVLMHHESVDGSGYPSGKSGDAIPFVARLIHVAESFVAMISKRNYRSISDKESALNELKAKAGCYDEKILAALEQII